MCPLIIEVAAMVMKSKNMRNILWHLDNNILFLFLNYYHR
jgi:hypothetical protein